jgi:methionyl-tRNA synthetase
LAKNNGELLNNLGNFSYRALSFLKAKFDGALPAYEGDQHENDRPFIQSLIDSINKYMGLMDAVKLKDGLKEAMNYS